MKWDPNSFSAVQLYDVKSSFFALGITSKFLMIDSDSLDRSSTNWYPKLLSTSIGWRDRKIDQGKKEGDYDLFER